MQPENTDSTVFVCNDHRTLGGIVPRQGGEADDLAAPEAGRVGEELGGGILGINSDDTALESGDQKLYMYVRVVVVFGLGGGRE